MVLGVAAVLAALAFGLGRATGRDGRSVPGASPPAATVPAIPTPPPASPLTPHGPRRKATLEDVRRDWGLEGRLVCHTEGRPR